MEHQLAPLASLASLACGDLIVLRDYVFTENTGHMSPCKLAFVLEPTHAARKGRLTGAQAGFVCGLFTTKEHVPGLTLPAKFQPAHDYPPFITAARTWIHLEQIRPIRFEHFDAKNVSTVERFGSLRDADRKKIATVALAVLKVMQQKGMNNDCIPALTRAAIHSLDDWIKLPN
jgi:hypothetical protein